MEDKKPTYEELESAIIQYKQQFDLMHYQNAKLQFDLGNQRLDALLKIVSSSNLTEETRKLAEDGIVKMLLPNEQN